MFRTIQFKNGSASVLSDADEVSAPSEGERRWIDVQAPTPKEFELLQQRFGLHPIPVEECSRSHRRAKIDDYDEYLFLVTHSLSVTAAGRNPIKAVELDGFLGDRYLITIHREPLAAIDKVWNRAVTDPGSAGRGMDFLYYLIADELVDAIFPIIDRVSDELEKIETGIMTAVDTAQLPQLMRLKRWLITMRRLLTPARDMMAIMLRRGDRRISEKNSLYFRDVYDHLVRACEQIDVERDLLGNAMDAYLSMMANRSNIIMKQLTILASIFLPLTFVTGFFGQNFTALPFDSKWLFYVEMASCVGLPLAMFVWFRRSGWLKAS